MVSGSNFIGIRLIFWSFSNGGRTNNWVKPTAALQRVVRVARRSVGRESLPAVFVIKTCPPYRDGDSTIPFILRKSMSEINNPIRTSGSLPNDYQEVLYWRMTEKPIRVITLQILGVLFFVIFGLIFSSLAVSLGKLPLYFKFGLSEISSVIVGILLTFVLHELTHGWVMQMFGARPRYGILWKQMMFYATTPRYAYRRNNYVGISLAPFVFISTLVVLGMWLLKGTLWVALLGICGSINASGAIGDMWITMIVLRYATTAYVMDERDGIRVFLPKP